MEACSFLILLLTGLGLIACSSPLQTKMASIVSIITDQVVLKEGSFILPIWTDPPFEMYTDFYIFNWTNPDEVVSNGVKPNFTVLGPYKYPFLDTENVVLNISVAAAPPKVNESLEKDLLEFAIWTIKSKLHKELPVNDLIWGYTDSFIAALQSHQQDGNTYCRYLVIGGGTLAGAVMAPAALSAVGFGAAGVAAGSIAATIQTPVTAAGSWFAIAQSIGATGAASTTGAKFGFGGGALLSYFCP